jgi:hypothetical protein
MLVNNERREEAATLSSNLYLSVILKDRIGNHRHAFLEVVQDESWL